MAKYFQQEAREWAELYPDVFASNLHRYQQGGGAALFRVRAGAKIPEHDHPTGEHGYVIAGVGVFGSRQLSAGDAFWIEVGETHEIRAVTDLIFFATSLPRSAGAHA